MKICLFFKVHPAAQAYVRATAEATGAAAARRDKEKMEKHRASAEGGACGFVPLNVETYGRMGAPAMQLLCDLAELASEGGRQAALGAAGAAQAERGADAAQCMEDEGGVQYRGSLCGACVPGRPREARHERLSVC